jgi:hypothetical protein
LHDAGEYGTGFLISMSALAESNPNVRHIGNSDSGICRNYDPGFFSEMGAKMIIIRRDPAQVIESYRKYFSVYPYECLPDNWQQRVPSVIETTNNILDQFQSRYPADLLKVVPFEKLDNVRVMRGLWDWVVPEEKFCVSRFEILNLMRVNPAAEKVRF